MQTKKVTAVRNNLLATFDKLIAGDMDPKAAHEIAKTAGVIISSARVQVAYAALRRESPTIPFLEND